MLETVMVCLPRRASFSCLWHLRALDVQMWGCLTLAFEALMLKIGLNRRNRPIDRVRIEPFFGKMYVSLRRNWARTEASAIVIEEDRGMGTAPPWR